MNNRETGILIPMVKKVQNNLTSSRLLGIPTSLAHGWVGLYIILYRRGGVEQVVIL